MPSNRLSAENANFLMNCSEIEFTLKATRRSFILLLFFDLTFTSLLWLIYCTTKGLSLEDAYIQEIKNYNIDSSLFDVAVAAVARFFFLNLFYTILKINHWIPAAVITFASSSFLISKVVIFAIKGTHKIITDYLILIISFLVVWVQTWYLDVKIFSNVKKQAVLLETENSTILNQNFSSYGSINTPRRIRSEIASFYASPLESPEDLSDEEKESKTRLFQVKESKTMRKKPSHEVLSNLTNIVEEPKNEKYKEYEKLGQELINNVLNIYNDKTNWKTLAEFDLIDLVKEINFRSLDTSKSLISTKQFPKIGKVFKLETIIPFGVDLIIKVLRDDVEECTKWNITVKSSKIALKITKDLSIIHVCVYEQAGGLVSPRDFVNLNKYCYLNEEHILAAKACKLEEIPESEDYVRGENGPTGYIFSRIDDNSTRLTWILNVNLKGWLPQYLIDQSLSTVQKDFIITLIKYLNDNKSIL
ncbi:unnamed protein product [Brachionus calyciflorus]|uniref:StAR-related lipid transfer protein 3 n=1 Tax=Brachionus calyciflorus TaxID=104777 RepID=A0A813SDP4_9BILA|nr:unnamed protein product [Brachionus calyciflorus]